MKILKKCRSAKYYMENPVLIEGAEVFLLRLC
jgi:hypothetical protein